MATIESVLDIDIRDKYAIVHVITDDGTEANVFVGGEVELYHDPKYDVVKAFVRKKKTMNELEKLPSFNLIKYTGHYVLTFGEKPGGGPIIFQGEDLSIVLKELRDYLNRIEGAK